MNFCETRPRNRHHLSSRVQLHRARAEWNHGVYEREVPRLKLVHVAEHFCLRVVLVEYRMRQERSRPVAALVVTRVCSQSEILDAKVWILSEIEGNQEVGDVVVGDGFIESNDDASVVHEPHVDSTTSRFIHDRLPVSLAKRDPNRVEVVVVHDAVTESAQTLCQRTRECVHASRNLRESSRPVVDGVHARHYGKEHLRRADVARRLFAADVLLSRLQRHPQRWLSVRIARNADYASWNVPLEFVLRREVRGMWAAVAERNSEPLCISDGDVGAPFSGR